MGNNSDGVIGRHGDGEKKVILLRVPVSPFPRVLFLPYQHSSIPFTGVTEPRLLPRW
jgi:hypothetical protein